MKGKRKGYDVAVVANDAFCVVVFGLFLAQKKEKREKEKKKNTQNTKNTKSSKNKKQ